MFKSTYLSLAVLAVVGLVAVQAGVVDWFGDEAKDRERRADNKCNAKSMKALSDCCNTGVLSDADRSCMSSSRKAREALPADEAAPAADAAPKKKAKKTGSKKSSKKLKSSKPCIKCALEAAGLVGASGELDIAAYTKNYTGEAGALSAAVATCQADTSNNEDGTGSCATKAVKMYECIGAQLALSCPAEKVKAGECSTKITEAKSCSGAGSKSSGTTGEGKKNKASSGKKPKNIKLNNNA